MREEKIMKSLFKLVSTLFLLLTFASQNIILADEIPPPTIDLKTEAKPQKNDKPASSVPSIDESNEVTIIQKKDAVVEEVRVNGKLRYAKITPKKGKPYYLYDSNGDGVLDATETDVKKANVNQWILMEW